MIQGAGNIRSAVYRSIEPSCIACRLPSIVQTREAIRIKCWPTLVFLVHYRPDDANKALRFHGNTFCLAQAH